MTLELILAEPRGFCAGVRRAIDVVELALAKFGAPLYVKHEIVHNKYVLESLRSKGVVFTDDLTIIPEGSVVIYSAHGVSDAIELQAKSLKLMPIDATCPLVKKVHREVAKYEADGCEIILVGHKNHPEIEGTAGKIKHDVIIVESEADAHSIMPKNPEKLALATQTTLSLDDTASIIAILQERFPILKENSKNDICYATQNRQDAVKQMIAKYSIDTLFVVGAANSSNSNRLRDIGSKLGVESFLINDSSEVDLANLQTSGKIGITAGASAPEVLVESVIDLFKSHFSDVTITLMNGAKEDTVFFLPRELR